MGPIQHFNAVALKPQHLGHVDDHAAVAHQKFRLGLKLFLHLCKICRGPALAVIRDHTHITVLCRSIVDLGQRQPHDLPGNAHLQLRLLALELPCQLLKLFFLIRLEQIIEWMYRKGIPHVLRRGCHKHDQQVRVGRTQPLRRLNAIGALHADVQKHYLIPFAPAGPQKFISAGKTAAGYILIFKCLFQQLFQPFGIRLAVFHDRRLQVHCCTPLFLLLPCFFIL